MVFPIVTAALPELPLAKSYAASSLLSELMIGKYVNHLPFYRQIQMFKQLEVTIPASTLNDWFKSTESGYRTIEGLSRRFTDRRADEENLSYDDRAELRSRLACPIMCAFEKWILREYPQVLPNGRIGKALRYTYTIYHRLSRYHLDGRYRIDNNLAENAIRPIALRRKNYLFCGNHSAAEDAAVIYSLFACCKEAEVNFRQWMVYVQDNIHSYDNDYSKDLAELLPKQWKENNAPRNNKSL
jgi:hypothetical protein